ncbi:hypothetical protein [Ulvibacterium marinum]|uniref:Uncharacterized protein n=1 Tax=Ulvibacterium marinum TaxID=2419782 RepID=A0A3B0CFM7_9FLAO|nr:hypothetical protein [Ulvibacterium marinum]RKN83494.1 hypothetical protein D7Z94_06665 [Ulvibacterium marinum]
MNLSRYTKRAILGGVIALAVIGLSTFMLGKLSGYEAKELIKSSIDGLNTLCNTIALASATILALMLTLLGVSSNTSSSLKDDHYKHILQLAKLDTVIFVASILFFLIFNLPVTESENIPANWFSTIYYITLGISTILSSALVVVVLMLYNTIANIIKIVGLGIKDHPLAMQVQEEGEDDTD